MGTRKTLLLYTEQLKAVLPRLSMQERGTLLTALFEHATGLDVSVELSGGAGMAYSIMAMAIDENYQRYDRVCEKRSEAAKKSHEARTLQMHANAASASNSCQVQEQVQVQVQEQVQDNILYTDAKASTTTKTKRSVFKKPTLEEVEAYCTERSNGIDAGSFVDYYEANGWKVGRSPMKDWKAAVRTWERKRKPSKSDRTFDEFDRFVETQEVRA